MANKKRFLNPQDVEDAIVEVARIAQKENISVALIGGVAMEIFGSDRMTKDIDFVCSAMPSSGIIPKRTLSFGGISGSTKHGHPVDLVVRNDVYEALYDEALAQAIEHEDLPVKLVTPPYLAAMKMAAGRDKDEMDLKTLMHLHVLDLNQTIDIIKRHLGVYAVQEFRALLDEIAWRETREK